MKWCWTSHRGQEQSSNNDAVAIAKCDSCFFAIVTDAAAKTTTSAELADYWGNELATQVLLRSQALRPEDLIAIMRDVHKKLRHSFLHDIASYIAVLVDRNSGQAWCLSCGDCRLSIKTDQADDIRWITNVHTLANATGELLAFTESTNPARHILTRSLNAKRFAAPDVIDLAPLDHGQSWILCSDGFWAEHLGNNIPLGQQSDDASHLEISLTLPAGLQRTDCCNYSVHTQG